MPSLTSQTVAHPDHLPACGEREFFAAGSATRTNAVVDFIVLPPNRAVKRRRSRRLRNAWPRDGLAGRRQVILIQKMPGRRLAELRGDKAVVVLPKGRNARGGHDRE